MPNWPSTHWTKPEQSNPVTGLAPPQVYGEPMKASARPEIRPPRLGSAGAGGAGGLVEGGGRLASSRPPRLLSRRRGGPGGGGVVSSAKAASVVVASRPRTKSAAVSLVERDRVVPPKACRAAQGAGTLS